MAARITVNIASIRDKALRFSYPKANSVGLERAKKIIDNRKSKFLKEFDDHEISREIKAGPQPNFGVDGVNGNLYSFIGFDSGSTPVQDLYYYFEQSIRLVRRRGEFNLRDKTITYKMSSPTTEGMRKVTDMENYATENNNTQYGEGISWVYMIENGIPGLSFYKYSLDSKVLGGESRSGTGLQRRNVIHAGAEYQAREYVTELLKILEG